MLRGGATARRFSSARRVKLNFPKPVRVKAESVRVAGWLASVAGPGAEICAFNVLFYSLLPVKKFTYLAAPLLGTLALAATLSGCKHDTDTQPGVGTVSIEMENVAKMSAPNGGTQPVTANSSSIFTTASGEKFTVSTFKYYISNVVFTKTDGSTYAVPKFYHLVDASSDKTTEFDISNVPTGDYSGMQFMVGVDSTTTKADPLTFVKELEPLFQGNNMYWDWNSGHIFLKLEGNVPAAGNQAFRAHVGGFRQPYYAIVTAKPSFNGNKLSVRADHSPEIHLTADVLQIWDGPNKFAPSTFPPAMMPSANSVKVAQNYGTGTTGGGMFTVEHIHAN